MQLVYGHTVLGIVVSVCSYCNHGMSAHNVEVVPFEAANGRIKTGIQSMPLSQM